MWGSTIGHGEQVSGKKLGCWLSWTKKDRHRSRKVEEEGKERKIE